MISDADKQGLIVGLKQVKKALQNRTATKVFIADDCDFYLKKSLEELCEAAGIIPEVAGTMTELGSECGISVKASCACVCR